MNVNELLQRIEPGKVSIQILRPSIEGIATTQSPVITRIIFVTHVSNLKPSDLLRDEGRVGVVLWIDREAYAQTMIDAEPDAVQQGVMETISEISRRTSPTDKPKTRRKKKA